MTRRRSGLLPLASLDSTGASRGLWALGGAKVTRGAASHAAPIWSGFRPEGARSGFRPEGAWFVFRPEGAWFVSPGQRPGFGQRPDVPPQRGGVPTAPKGHGSSETAPIQGATAGCCPSPRALPWAGERQPVGLGTADTSVLMGHGPDSAPKGHGSSAQGNVVGPTWEEIKEDVRDEE
jgi:hypothetical protein